MPVISSEDYGFNGRRIKRQVKCSSKGVFSMDLPSEVVALLGCPSEVTGASKEEVIKLWGEKVAQFSAARTTTRKVIAYRVVYQGPCVGRLSDIQGEDHYMRSRGVSLSIMVGVLDEITTETDGANDSVRYQDVPSVLPSTVLIHHSELNSYSRKNYTVLPWTDELETFFALMAASFENLVLSLDEFFKDSDQLQARIEAGNLPMLPAGKPAEVDTESHVGTHIEFKDL